MSVDNKDPNGMPVEANGDNQEDQVVADGAIKQDTVKYESYRKVVSANKAKDAKLEELAAQLASMQENELAKEGKKDELIAQLQNRLNETDKKYRGAVGSFAQGKALDAIVDQAVKIGCSSTSLLRKVVSDRLSELEFDEQFNPNAEQVKMLLEDVRKSEPVLFGKPAPSLEPHNLNPNGGVKGKKSISDMTPEEQDRLARDIDKSEGKTLGWR